MSYRLPRMKTVRSYLAGAWVESMHLVTGQIDQFKEGDPVLARVAEQKVTLDHLVDMMGEFKNDSTVASALKGMLRLRDLYDGFKVERAPHKGASPSGRLILGDDVNIEMDAEGFDRLKAAVEVLRADIIHAGSTAATSPNS